VNWANNRLDSLSRAYFPRPFYVNDRVIPKFRPRDGRQGFRLCFGHIHRYSKGEVYSDRPPTRGAEITLDTGSGVLECGLHSGERFRRDVPGGRSFGHRRRFRFLLCRDSLRTALVRVLKCPPRGFGGSRSSRNVWAASHRKAQDQTPSSHWMETRFCRFGYWDKYTAFCTLRIIAAECLLVVRNASEFRPARQEKNRASNCAVQGVAVMDLSLTKNLKDD
jgi:hypothetical protein